LAREFFARVRHGGPAPVRRYLPDLIQRVIAENTNQEKSLI